MNALIRNILSSSLSQQIERREGGGGQLTLCNLTRTHKRAIRSGGLGCGRPTGEGVVGVVWVAGGEGVGDAVVETSVPVGVVRKDGFGEAEPVRGGRGSEG
jgi:hypothetical protein